MVIGKASPTIVKIKTFLDKKTDQVFTTQVLRNILDLGSSALQRNDAPHNYFLKGYYHRIRMMGYWGNPKSISRFKRQLPK
jgi:S-adenosylmethionine synthetase